MKVFRQGTIFVLFLLVAFFMAGCGKKAGKEALQEQVAQLTKRLDNLGRQYKELVLANEELKTALNLVTYRLLEGKSPQEVAWLFLNALQYRNGSLARIYASEGLRENFSSTLQGVTDPHLARFKILEIRPGGGAFRCTARLWFASPGKGEVFYRDDTLLVKKAENGIYLVDQVITGKERTIE